MELSSSADQNNTFSVVQDIIGITAHLRDLGYGCGESAAEDIMRVFSTSHADSTEPFASAEDFHNCLETVMRPLVVQTHAQDASFHADFSKYFRDYITPSEKEESEKKLKKLQDEIKSAAQSKDNYENALHEKEKAEQNLKDWEKAMEYAPHEPYASESVRSNGARLFKKAEKDLKKITAKESSDVKDVLCNMDDLLSGKRKYKNDAIQNTMNTIPEIMKKSAGHGEAVMTLPYLKWCYTQLKSVREQDADSKDSFGEKLKKTLDLKIQNLNYYANQKEKYENEDPAERQKKQNEIEKLEAFVHRKVFDDGSAHNAVKTLNNLNDNNGRRIDFEDDPLLNKDFDALTESEKREIEYYIRSNVQRFRTRMTRTIRVKESRKIDISATIKKACGTDGIPVRLCHVKPKRNKTKIVMFLDISGSCRAASELMLYFMYTIQDVFPAGCRSYVFVNKLYDVSDIFAENDIDEAIREVGARVPTRGVYSDYGTPFTSFHENDMAKLTRDSLVFFIGDARNNKNATGEDAVKAISRRGRDAFWLETDDRSEWNQGDSIINVYAPYMSKVSEIRTPAQLIHFIDTLKVRNAQ